MQSAASAKDGSAVLAASTKAKTPEKGPAPAKEGQIAESASSKKAGPHGAAVWLEHSKSYIPVHYPADPAVVHSMRPGPDQQED